MRTMQVYEKDKAEFFLPCSIHIFSCVIDLDEFQLVLQSDLSVHECTSSISVFETSYEQDFMNSN